MKMQTVIEMAKVAINNDSTGKDVLYELNQSFIAALSECCMNVINGQDCIHGDDFKYIVTYLALYAIIQLRRDYKITQSSAKEECNKITGGFNG